MQTSKMESRGQKHNPPISWAKHYFHQPFIWIWRTDILNSEWTKILLLSTFSLWILWKMAAETMCRSLVWSNQVNCQSELFGNLSLSLLSHQYLSVLESFMFAFHDIGSLNLAVESKSGRRNVVLSWNSHLNKINNQSREPVIRVSRVSTINISLNSPRLWEQH